VPLYLARIGYGYRGRVNATGTLESRGTFNINAPENLAGPSYAAISDEAPTLCCPPSRAR
jgi:hypothetical protein